jgi:hypothetical protein
MKYVIKSMKVGIIGDEFEPSAGINVAALLDGGFIAIQESTDSTKKTPTIKKTPKE